MPKRNDLNNSRILGIDEAGRGPLAGPVVSAAVRIVAEDSDPVILNLKSKVKDSKKLTFRKREELYHLLTCHPAIEWGVGMASEKEVDKFNVLEATKLSMERALENIDIGDSMILIDGNFSINVNCIQRSLICADEKVLECSMASIVAKVSRDSIMKSYHENYPEYGFDKNKGYGTKKHRAMIAKYGASPVHRRSFKLF